MNQSEIRQFQAGGALRAGAYYVARSADVELPTALMRGEFCYVLAPRQMGKSSLRLRTKQHLEHQEIRCVSIDLTTIGSRDTSAEQWYFSIIDEVAQQLRLVSPDSFWNEHALHSPVHRFLLFLRRQLLEQITGPVVIFVDELDATLSQSGISRDDFFAAVRACYNARAEDAEFERLCFCLIGVALPSDLITDETRTPFNIGTFITLSDFSRAEMDEFLPGLVSCPDARGLLDAVYEWTGGHPYMTQKVCQHLVGNHVEGLDARQQVQRVVGHLFLRRGRVLETNLSYAEKFFAPTARSPRTLPMLRLYGRLLGGEAIAAHGHDPIQSALRLTGMAAERRDAEGVWLVVRNQIFATVFDRAWVRQQENDRMFAEPLQRWLESNRSEDHVLRGHALVTARLWSRNHRELTAEEGSFLLASLDVEERAAAERKRLAAVERAAQHAAAEQLRMRQQVEFARRQQLGILVVTEALERFGFYLMLSLFTLYLNEQLGWSQSASLDTYGWYMFAVYLTPFLGGILADRFVGNRYSVLGGMLLLACGYFLVAQPWHNALPIALGLLALGHGLFKSNISALVGSLYAVGDPRRDSAFSVFYVAINLGAVFSGPVGALVRSQFGWVAAFSTAGVALLLASAIFGLLQQHWSYVDTSDDLTAPVARESLNLRTAVDARVGERQRLEAVLIVCFSTIVFWLALQQNGATLTYWARDNVDRTVTLVLGYPFAGGQRGATWTIQPSMFQSMNSVFCIAVTPLLVWGMRKLQQRNLEPSTPVKMIIGMVLTSTAYTIVTLACMSGGNHGKVSLWWLMGYYLLISVGELFVSPMGMSIVTRLAPQRMSAMFVGIWFLATALGNWFAGRSGGWLWSRWEHSQFFALLAAISLTSAGLLFTQRRRINEALRLSRESQDPLERRLDLRPGLPG